MNNGVVRIIFVIVSTILLYKANLWYVDYKMMKEAIEKIEFLKKNKASQSDICSAISYSILVASNQKNQEKYDELKDQSRQFYCGEY